MSDTTRLTELDTVARSDSSRADYITKAVSADEAWVYIADERIAGYAVINRSFFSRVTIEMLMIDTKHLRSGIGTMLLRHLEELCDSDELWTSTNLSNTPMQRLLMKLEYEMTGFVNNLDPGDPELVFYKRLSKPR